MHRIDAHQHFWETARGDYAWLAEHPQINRDFQPTDLQPHNQDSGITATVAVQAAATDRDTDYLIDLAEQYPWIAKVVAWADLESPAAADRLAQLAQNPAVAGIRPMLQDLADPEWAARPRVAAHLASLGELGLTWDFLGYPEHLAPAWQAIRGAETTTVIIDHLAKPRYESRPPQMWADQLRTWAQRENTVVKISGMITEIGSDWSLPQIRPNVEFVLELFGTSRVMFGSDWPVCLRAGTHTQVVDLAAELTSGFSPDEAADFWYRTAARCYQIKIN